jgi:hypothetical protein
MKTVSVLIYVLQAFLEGRIDCFPSILFQFQFQVRLLPCLQVAAVCLTGEKGLTQCMTTHCWT